LFDFTSGQSNAEYPDCDFEETPFANNGQLQQAGLRTCMGGDDIANLGVTNFDTATIPANDRFECNPPAKARSVYVVKTREGGYVKVLVTAVHNMDEVSFRWMNLPGKWKTKTTLQGIVKIVVDDNTTVECNLSKGKEVLSTEHALAYNNLTTYMAAGKGNTSEAKAAYKRYQAKKACYEQVLNS
ncbi:MAG: hypothetical protein ABIH11_07665, partial [Candidatus Altiarchaeota archaeon]